MSDRASAWGAYYIVEYHIIILIDVHLYGLKIRDEENDRVGTSLKMKNHKVNIIFSGFGVKEKYKRKITTTGSIVKE